MFRQASWRAAGAALALAIVVSADVSPAAAQDRWGHEAREWAGAAAVLGGVYLLDVEVRDRAFIRADSTVPALVRFAEPLGRTYVYPPVLGLLAGTGWASGNDRLRDGALHAAAALAMADLGTRGIKFLVGRGRPDTPGTDGDEFQPLSADPTWNSFPSGHATTAFAMATTLSHEADEPWVTAAAYGTATLVAYARVRQNRHWASDVVAGALVGAFLSEVTLRWIDGADDDGPADEGGIPVVLQFAIPVR